MEEPSQVRAQMAGCQKREFFAKGFRRSSGTEPHSSGQMSWGFLALTTHCNATAGAEVMAKSACVGMGRSIARPVQGAMDPDPSA